jgi:hypothetical protein
VDTSLLYHSQRRAAWFPAPPSTYVFASQSMARPGGAVQHAAAFLSQLYYYPAPGAAILTALAGLLALASAGYMALTFRRRPSVLHLVPALLAVLPLARYDNPLTPALAVFAATAAACAYSAVPGRWWPARVAALVILAAACQWVAGAAVLLLGLLCALHEAAGRRASSRRWSMAAVALAVASAAPFAGARVLGVPAVYAYTVPLFAGPTLAPGAIYLLVPLYAALPVLTAVEAVRRHRKGSERAAGPLAVAAGAVAVLCLWACALFLLDDPQLRLLVQIDGAMASGNWEQALSRADSLQLRRFDHLVLWDVNRALCHAGHMGDRMFAYPQSTTSLMPMPADLLPGYTRPGLGPLPRATYLKCLNAMYDLGRLNDAELIAHEAWEMVGQHARVMRRLVMINIAKEESEAASAFLHNLAGDPVWSGWACAMLERLRDDPKLTGDPDVERLRRCRDVRNARDYVPEEQALLDLLEADPGNRTAFEYLMAWYLLTRQLDKFVGKLGSLHALGYEELPRHYAEALQLYRLLTMQAAELPGYEASPETRTRTEEFLAAVESYGRDREGARTALVPAYRDIYPFYYVFARAED